MTRPASEPREIDLHTLSASAARHHLTAALRSLRATAPGTRVRIVTGAGHRSAGAPVLFALVQGMLRTGLPEVAAWEPGADGGSFLVTIGGSARGPATLGAGGRRDPAADRAWFNARQLEYARRQAARRAASERDEAEEAARLAALRRECGGRDLPEWFAAPPPDLVRRREVRRREEERDRVEYSLTREEYEARG